MRKVLISLIRLYQIVLSPWLGNNCRFSPSCSQYATDAIATHGSWRGMTMTIRRLSRCHPWHAGGYDPVPGCAKSETH